MINYYFDNTNELKPYTHQLDANNDTLPPDNALRIAPKFECGYWPCEQNGRWILVEDNREKTAYNLETKEAVTIDYIGKIKDGFTLLEPFAYSKWDDEKWVLNEDEKNTHIIKQNKAKQHSLINEANDKIAVLQDTIDLGMQENDEEAKLKQWKKYRIMLTRINTSNIDIVFPEKP